MEISIRDYRHKDDRAWKISSMAISKHNYLNEHIKIPIRIQVQKLAPWNIGEHTMDILGIFKRHEVHLIRIADNLDSKTANEVLWHELCHCVQVEQHENFDIYWEDYVAKGGNATSGTDYRGNIYEVEANEFSDYHAPQYNLIES